MQGAGQMRIAPLRCGVHSAVMPVLVAFLAIFGSNAHCASPSEALPPGAAVLGYTKALINERPVAEDISYASSGRFKWFSGQWYARKRPSKDRHVTTDGTLTLELGGDVVSAPHDFSEGQLPLLSGRTGFYVEFEVRLSDNDPDHWPAVWLMPAEHDDKQRDHNTDDPKGFERWVEIDVDEGGFGPGLTGTVHCWSGTYPRYQNEQNTNNVSSQGLDRSKNHTFGAGFSPGQNRVTWWLDGVEQMSADLPCDSRVATNLNFYLIISAQSHGRNKPYSMSVRRVRAFVPPN